MADLNQGTRQRNLRQLSGSAAVPSGNTRSVSTGGPPAPSTDWIQALGGRIGGWCIENGKLTADGGNVKLNSFAPSISLGAASDYITGTGFWVGKHSAVYKLHLGDPAANHLKWDGSTLTVVGTISATAGAIGNWTIGTDSISADGGAAVIDSSVPKITLGAASDYLTGAGFFVGKSGGAYKFSIGSLAGSYLSYDGGTGALTLNGTVTTNSLNPALQSFTTSIVFSSTDNNTVSWTAGTIRLASGVTYSITAGNTGDMAALTYIYLDTAVSTTALQTTTTYSNAVGDNRLLLAAAQNHGAGAAGASVIPYTGQQPIINGTDQITALSITAAQIAANTITAGKLSVSQLSAIAADLGSITAGTITGGLIRTAASPAARIELSNTLLAGYSDATTKQFYIQASDGKAYAGNGSVVLSADGLQLKSATLQQPQSTLTFYLTDFGGDPVRQDSGSPTGYAEIFQALAIAGTAGANVTTPQFQHYWGGSWRDQGLSLTLGGHDVYYGTTHGISKIELGQCADGAGIDIRPLSGNITHVHSALLTDSPRFLARVSSGILNVTGDGTGHAVIFGTEVYDDNSNFNPATGVFTAPIAGRYHFDFTVGLEGITSAMSFAILDLIAGGRTFRSQRIHAYNCFDGAALAMHGSADAAMAAGQTAYVVIYVFGGSKVVDVTGHATEMLSYFNGHLVSAWYP